MKPLKLIFSSGGTPRFAEIALRHGWIPGARLPCTVYERPFFVDNEYRHFKRDPYVAAVQEQKPMIATLRDLESWDQLDEVIRLGDDIAPYVQQALIIIPKVSGIIKYLPREIGGVPVLLAYSVETSNGKTSVSPQEFDGWGVHLLGGSPQKQMALAQGWMPRGKRRALFDMPDCNMNVVSVDTNYHQERANEHAAFWVNGTATGCKNRYFPTLTETGNPTRDDAPYIAFEKSSTNIMQAWRNLGYRVNDPLDLKGINVRVATEADIPHIIKIARQWPQELGYVMIPALRESIARGNLLVAESLRQIVGFCNYRARRDNTQTVYEIAVHRNWQGKGIGAGLLAAVPGPIRLKCTTDNTANRFYETQGFTHQGIDSGKKRPLNIWHRAG